MKLRDGLHEVLNDGCLREQLLHQIGLGNVLEIVAQKSALVKRGLLSCSLLDKLLNELSKGR